MSPIQIREDVAQNNLWEQNFLNVFFLSNRNAINNKSVRYTKLSSTLFLSSEKMFQGIKINHSRRTCTIALCFSRKETEK